MYLKLLIMGRGAEACKYILVKIIHKVIAVFNSEAQWDFSVKLIKFIPRRLATVQLTESKQTKY